MNYLVRYRTYDEDCEGTHYDVYQTETFDSLKEAEERVRVLSLWNDDASCIAKEKDDR